MSALFVFSEVNKSTCILCKEQMSSKLFSSYFSSQSDRNKPETRGARKGPVVFVPTIQRSVSIGRPEQSRLQWYVLNNRHNQTPKVKKKKEKWNSEFSFHECGNLISLCQKKCRVATALLQIVCQGLATFLNFLRDTVAFPNLQEDTCCPTQHGTR